jgi:M6 family metalloprotease-like protein
MKRNLLALALAAMTVVSASAVPAKRLTKTVTQPDGSTITLTQIGDERYHAYVTSDGLTVDFTPEGYAVYNGVNGVSQIYAHELNERTAEEQSFIASKSTELTFQACRAASPRYQQMIATQKPATVKMSRSNKAISIEQEDSQVPHVGEANIPVLLVNYTDVKFKDDDPKATFEKFFNEGESSVYQYFRDMSNKAYDPKFKVMGPYTLAHNRKYYGGTSSTGSDEHPGYMVNEAVKLADEDPDIDFSIFDNDGDGECDVVIVLYAGVGQASSGLAQAVWPCQWTLSADGGTVNVDGVKVDKFAVFNELNGTYQNQVDGVGTVCHEFSHCLGLPDFYDTNYSGKMGMDYWSVMDTGCYNNDGYTPLGYSAYEKAFMGWITLHEGEANTKYTLPVLNDMSNPQTEAVVLVNDKDNDEYFIFENRKKQGWDAYMSDEGMLITHVTYKAYYWTNNLVNNYTLQRMTVVPADNLWTSSTLSADLWPKSYATEFTDDSKPAAKVNTGSTLGKPVTEITRDSSTGVVTFWVDRAPVPTLTAPVFNDPTVDNNNLTISWQPVEQEGVDVTYSLSAWEQVTSVPAPTVWYTPSTHSGADWSIENYVKAYTNYTLFGNSSSVGKLTSSETVTPTDGVITVAAKVARYSSDKGVKMVISLIDSDNNVAASETITIPDTASNTDYLYYSAAFVGLDNSQSYKIRIANEAVKARFKLTEILGFSGDYQGADDDLYTAALNEAMNPSASAPARVAEEQRAGKHIVVTGITDSSYTITGLTDGIYNYRVKAIPVDEALAYESEWSDVESVELGSTGIAEVNDNVQTASYLILNGEIVATPGAKLYSVSGVEMAGNGAGRFSVAPGAYILVTPGFRPAKIVL